MQVSICRRRQVLPRQGGVAVHVAQQTTMNDVHKAMLV